MTVKAAAKAWDLNLEPLDKLVALAIADEAADDHGVHYADADRLAEKTGLAPGAVRSAIDRLCARGVLWRVSLWEFRWAA